MKFVYRVSSSSSSSSNSSIGKKRCIGESNGGGNKKRRIEENSDGSYLNVLPQEIYDRICKYTRLSDYRNLLAASERPSNEYRVIFDFTNDCGDLHGYTKFSDIQLRRRTQYTDCVCDELRCGHHYQYDQYYMWLATICGHSRLKITLDVINETVQRNCHLYNMNIIQSEDYDIQDDDINMHHRYDEFEPLTVCGLCNKNDKCPRNIFIISLLKYLNDTHNVPSTFNVYLINETIVS
uniref:DekiORF138 n=1 Tax=Dendrolimus kikuchii nucleopolyhedrovirus TaxID=1219875 RepID=V9LT13_9ABAC|nr:DekiORF138 [Dendrolimus kikuchii nucleopolyhedrovirus]